MATWYYMANQTDRIGPINDNAMRALIQSDQIMHNTLVFKSGETEWKRAGDIPELVAMHKRTSSAVASRIPPFEPFPWLVGAIGHVGEGWGVEVTFEGASADEIKALSGLFQHYHSCAFQRLPRIASGSRQESVVFVFPPSRETPVNVFAHSPIASNTVNAFRSYLGGVAGTLRTGNLGIWSVDPRLAFFADGNFHVVPSFWLPAFLARKTRYQGAADGWRDNAVQPNADEYAIASACFHAATGKPYDPDSGLLPGDIFAGAVQWNTVLGSILQASLPATVHGIPIPFVKGLQASEQRQAPLSQLVITPALTNSETKANNDEAVSYKGNSGKIQRDNEKTINISYFITRLGSIFRSSGIIIVETMSRYYMLLIQFVKSKSKTMRIIRGCFILCILLFIYLIKVLPTVFPSNAFSFYVTEETMQSTTITITNESGRRLKDVALILSTTNYDVTILREEVYLQKWENGETQVIVVKTPNRQTTKKWMAVSVDISGPGYKYNNTYRLLVRLF